MGPARDWVFIGAIALITLIACVRVAATHRTFSVALDEPVHLASGAEWLRGKYTNDPTHPPLSRIFFALPLSHLPIPTSTDMTEAGNELLYYGNRYHKNLARGRLGNLVMLILAIVSVALWARRRWSSEIAILSAAIYSLLPPILAHSGLMTTDMAVAATFPLVFFAADRFVENATLRRAIFFGFCVGLGYLSKFSFFLYFPAAFIGFLLVRRPLRLRARAVTVAILVTIVVVWGGYWFHFGKPADEFQGANFYVEFASGPTLQPFLRWLAQTPVPAPEMLVGMAILKHHDRDGHLTYLLGQHSTKGWWYYFPVVLFYKSPLPFLILVAWGIVMLIRARSRLGWELVVTAIGVLLVAMTGSINIGVRHVLPVYAPLSIVAAIGAHAIWTRARDAFSRTTLAALLAWLLIGSAAAHPDYLAWFNELAGENPSRIVVDSNLDWGQDVLRLSRAIQRRKIERISMAVLHNVRLHAHGIESSELTPMWETRGWVAISETRARWGERTGEYGWLMHYQPVERVGKSIRLYYIP